MWTWGKDRMEEDDRQRDSDEVKERDLSNKFSWWEFKVMIVKVFIISNFIFDVLQTGIQCDYIV